MPIKQNTALDLVLLDYTNDTGKPRDCVYASVTAPTVVRVEIEIDGALVEVVYAGNGGTHSWWTEAGGKLFPADSYPNGLPNGSRLIVRADNIAAFRIDWFDQ